MVMAAAPARADKVNNSLAGGLFWSTAKEEGDLMMASEANDDSSVVGDHDPIDGGFSTLDGMLQWAIGKFPGLLFFFLCCHVCICDEFVQFF